MQYNWKPVIASLLSTLQEDGFTLERVDNGVGRVALKGTPRERRQKAKLDIAGVDEAHLFVGCPDGKLRWLFVVLGNEPEELVADHTSNASLEKSVDRFSAKWEGKSCPTK